MVRKTEIEHVYTPPSGFLIEAILSYDIPTIFILRSKTDYNLGSNVGKSTFIDKFIDGIVVKSCAVPYFEPSLRDKFSSQVLFRYGSFLGIFNANGGITLLHTSNLEVFQILHSSNMTKEDDPILHLHFASYNDDTNELYVGIDGYNNIDTISAKFLSKAVNQKSNIFNFYRKNRFSYKYKSSLPLDKYPNTWGGSYSDEWLNINSMMTKNNSVYIHTNGGGETRLKAGKRFEFSFISKLDCDFNWIENFKIEEGLGIFSGNKKYFILHARKKRNKLFFYDSKSYEIKFDISLTPKQNLGKEKLGWCRFDLNDKYLLLYSATYLHVCRFLN